MNTVLYRNSVIFVLLTEPLRWVEEESSSDYRNLRGYVNLTKAHPCAPTPFNLNVFRASRYLPNLGGVLRSFELP